MTLSSDEISGMRSTIDTVQLDHLCDIARRTQNGTDASGNPTYTWDTVVESEPCHFWESSETELIGTENALITKRRLVLRANIDLTPLDRVTKLVDNDSDIVENEFEIKQVLSRLNETVCSLEEIS